MDIWKGMAGCVQVGWRSWQGKGNEGAWNCVFVVGMCRMVKKKRLCLVAEYVFLRSP